MNQTLANVSSGNTSVQDDTALGTISPSYPYNLIAMAAKMHWYSSAVCGTIVVTFGVLVNILSIKVWKKKSMASGSTPIYLIAQAVNDIGVLIFFFITDSLQMIAPSLRAWYPYGVFHSYIGYPFFYFFVVNSIWTTVGVTVDRYIQVCWFVQAKALCRTKNAMMGIGLISVLCFLVNSPHFNTYKPVPSTERSDDEPAFNMTSFAQGVGSQMYEFWVHCMFLVLVPWVTIFVLNMTILRNVYNLNKNMLEKRGQTGKDQAKKRETQMTKMLLSVTFTFLVLIALQCITQCFFMMQPASADLRIVDEAYAVAKIGVIINSSINFILYCLSGECFRKELRKMFLRWIHCSHDPFSGSQDSDVSPQVTINSHQTPTTKIQAQPNSFDRI